MSTSVPQKVFRPELVRGISFGLLNVLLLTIACRSILYIGQGRSSSWILLLLSIATLFVGPILREASEKRLQQQKPISAWWLLFWVPYVGYLLFDLYGSL